MINSNAEKTNVEVEEEFKTLPEIVINTQIPVITSNFELFRQKLELELKKFDLKVNADNVSLANFMATKLNSISKHLASFKKEKVDELLVPINAFKADCSTLDALVQSKRQILLQQIKVYEDIERAECLEMLKKVLQELYAKFGVKDEYQTVQVDDLAIISNKTKSGVAKKAKDTIENRVLRCKRFQEAIELRLNTLEGVCLKAGLEAPLTRVNIESFLKEENDELYENKLNILIQNEIKRLSGMKADIEKKALQNAEAKLKSVNAPVLNPTNSTVSTHVSQPQQSTQRTSVKLTGNVKRYVVTAVFEVETDEAYEPYLEGHLLNKFNKACIKNLPKISIAEKQLPGENIMQNRLQKEGSDF